MIRLLKKETQNWNVIKTEQEQSRVKIALETELSNIRNELVSLKKQLEAEKEKLKMAKENTATLKDKKKKKIRKYRHLYWNRLKPLVGNLILKQLLHKIYLSFPHQWRVANPKITEIICRHLPKAFYLQQLQRNRQ
jgi:hypothetical protein